MSSISRRASILCTCLVALLPGLGQASPGFLERIGPDNLALSELASTLGQGSRARINRIETQLLPLFTALPKSNGGILSPAVSRYALHRFFVHQSGWYVNGLEPEGNASSPTDFLKDRVPSHVLALVEQHLGGGGFGLHELAVLAATLEDLVHSESVDRVMKVYDIHGIPIQSSTTREMADVILQTYMLRTLLPRKNFESDATTSVVYIHLLSHIHEAYPNWDDTMLWARDVQMNLEYGERMERNPFQRGETQGLDFPFVVRVIEEIGAQFSRYQNVECNSMKWDMLEVEDGESGRVSLSNFHGDSFHRGWKEGADYLREVGALDETNPRRPSVIISNYLSIRPNCFTTSSFYSTCCIDECETLMTQLESMLAAPTGAPEEILSFISATSSDTVDSPRNLSETLLGRLHAIAKQHGGNVPLHGRLFAQWMHHAYPHECPYPQAPNASKVQRGYGEWIGTMTGYASAEEMVRSAIMMNGNSREESAAPELPWSDEEELVTDFEPKNASRLSVWNAIRSFACLALILSMWVEFRQPSKIAFFGLRMFVGEPVVSKMQDSHLV